MNPEQDEIGAFEAKTRLAELLRDCERGRSFIILRRGKAVARLVPLGESEPDSGPADLVAAFREVRRRIRKGAPVRDLIDEGRRL